MNTRIAKYKSDKLKTGEKTGYFDSNVCERGSMCILLNLVYKKKNPNCNGILNERKKIFIPSNEFQA